MYRTLSIWVALIFTSLMAVPLQSHAATEQMVTVNLENVPLKQLFKSIESQTTYHFSYLEDAVAGQSDITVKASRTPVSKVLIEALKGTNLEFKIMSDNTIAIAAKSKRTNGITGKIVSVTGVIHDSNGEPAIGATVRVRGTDIATMANIDGRFSIDAPEGSTLEVSYIGYSTQSVKNVDGSPVSVILSEDKTLLDEVVVVGYGAQRKGDLTGSIASVNSSTISSQRSTMLTSALQGTLAGVTVTRSESEPGSTGQTIRVRGVTTISDSSPLVIVDGVPGSLASVNPDDVESISVLKDAASAAIYGARAAAGVIIVTTKRAGDGALNLSYNFEYGWEKPTQMAKYVDAVRYMEMANELRYNDNPKGGWNQIYSQDRIDNWAANHEIDPYQYPMTDWLDATTKDSAPRYTHSIGISGGTNKVRNNTSLRFDKNEGLYAGREFNRFLARSNTDFNINKILSAHVDFYFSRSRRDGPNYNPFNSDNLATPPIYGVTWADGTWCDVKDGENGVAKILDGGFYNNMTQRAQGKLGIDLKPIDGLTISGIISPQWINTNGKTFVKQVPYYYASSPGEIKGNMTGFKTTRLSESRSNDYEITTQLFANYIKIIGKHDFAFMVGYEDYHADWESIGALRDQYELTNFPFLDLGSENFRDNSGSKTEYAYHSYFGRVSYNFDRRYLLQFNFRRDGSSRFAKHCRWANFPSVSAGWVISSENFFINAGMDWWNFLKLRGSWGQLGNERIGSYYPYQASIIFHNAFFYDSTGSLGSSTTAGQEKYAVENITWETTESWNAGLDANFLNSRLRLGVEVYRKTTRDMLLAMDIPQFIGYANPDVNAGRMNTEGYDMELGWNDRAGELNYSVFANFSDYVSRMGDLNGTQFLGSQVKMDGSEFNEWYGYLSDGLFQTQEDVDNSAKINNNTRVGDVKYKDISGPDGVPDGKISPEYDRVLLGGSLPRFTFGFGGSLEWRGFDMNVLFQGVGRRNVMLPSGRVAGFSGDWLNFPELSDGEYWSAKNSDAENLEAKYPRLTWTNRSSNFTTSDYWLFKARYLRMKNLTVGYTLPSKLTRKAFIEQLRFYVTGTDFLTFDNYPDGWDPEHSFGSAPINKSVVFGVNVKF